MVFNQYPNKMKNYFRLLFTLLFLSAGSVSAQELQPFYKVGTFDGSVSDVSRQVEKFLSGAGYELIGSYHPGNSDTLFVICFTNKALKELSLQFPDRGPLAAVLRAGLVRTQGKTTLSLLNPEYQFLAYWGQQLNGREEALKTRSDQVTSLFAKMGTLTPFGGKVERDRLMHYHYKMMMPYFDDPDELAEFDSFEQGLKTIQKNLAAGKGNTRPVYQLVFPDKKIAVFGVALLDKETGASDFLPVIGAGHVAAMPYEIILQGEKATSLAGKYRIALFWPELGMGTFMKIIKTPGRIEDTMKGLTTE